MNRKKAEKVLMLVVLIGLATYYLVQHKARNEIVRNHEETVGVIVDYYEIFPATHYLTYEYSVGNKKFKKQINPDVEFKGCPDTKDCIGRKFPVYYDPTKPENSIILLHNPQ